jgi:hypothetical protein
MTCYTVNGNDVFVSEDAAKRTKSPMARDGVDTRSRATVLDWASVANDEWLEREQRIVADEAADHATRKSYAIGMTGPRIDLARDKMNAAPAAEWERRHEPEENG